MRAARGWWRSLGLRFGLVAVLCVVAATLVVAAVGAQVLQGVTDNNSRRIVRMVADADAARVRAGQPAAPALGPDATELDRVAVRRARIRRDAPEARRVTGDALAREALRPEQVRKVLDGQEVSTTARDEEGATVFVEARPTAEGGLVVAQRRRDGLTQAVADRAVPLLVGASAGIAAAGALLALGLGLLSARPLRRLRQAVTALAGGRRDVRLPEQGPAEIADIAREVNALAAALAHAEARQREFLLSVSHDLRTPLTAISGYAETLAEGALDGPGAVEAGAVMAAESARLERMVADLLDLARLDAQEARLDAVRLDALDVLRQAATAWAPRCTARGLELRTEGVSEGAAWSVMADPGRLRQVLDNLLDNAVRVCPPGAPIVLAGRCVDGAVELEVRDGGPGLAPEDLAVAFERRALAERYRGRREVGTGLGLALVDRLVGRMGGEVRAGAAPEGGACFTVRLPVAE